MVPGTLSSDGRTTETGSSTRSSFHRFALSFGHNYVDLDYGSNVRLSPAREIIYIYVTVTTVTQSGEDPLLRLSKNFLALTRASNEGSTKVHEDFKLQRRPLLGLSPG